MKKLKPNLLKQSATAGKVAPVEFDCGLESATLDTPAKVYISTSKGTSAQKYKENDNNKKSYSSPSEVRLRLQQAKKSLKLERIR